MALHAGTRSRTKWPTGPLGRECRRLRCVSCEIPRPRASACKRCSKGCGGAAARTRACAELSQLRAGRRRQETAQKIEAPGEYTLDEDPIERQRVARALAALTEGQADVVRLAYYKGMTLAEVAAELAIPIGTVKGRLSAALRALRRSLVPETSHGI
jgi:RNA polymerase sigma factor (sigma-70 family)